MTFVNIYSVTRLLTDPLITHCIFVFAVEIMTWTVLNDYPFSIPSIAMAGLVEKMTLFSFLYQIFTSRFPSIIFPYFAIESVDLLEEKKRTSFLHHPAIWREDDPEGCRYMAPKIPLKLQMHRDINYPLTQMIPMHWWITHSTWRLDTNAIWIMYSVWLIYQLVTVKVISNQNLSLPWGLSHHSWVIWRPDPPKPR